MTRLRIINVKIFFVLLVMFSYIPIKHSFAQGPTPDVIFLLAKMRIDGVCSSEPYAACLGYNDKTECVREYTDVLDKCITVIRAPELLDKASGKVLSQCMKKEKAASTYLSKLETCNIIGDISRGENKSATCAACHGADGNSRVERNPTLAGLSQEHLVKAMQDYKSGVKQSAIMYGFTAALSAQDIRDLAAYYSSQESMIRDDIVPFIKEPTQQRKAGKHKVGVDVCKICHDKGIANAPKTGDVDAWRKLREKGFDALLSSVINGKGSMPARGGTNFTDAQLKSTLKELARF